MVRRPFSASLLLCTALLLSSQAAALVVHPAATPQALPSELVTLAYDVEGEGTYRFEVLSPEGWTPLTPSRTLTLSGRQFVPVTIRVPALAQAGPSPEIVIRVMQGDQEVGRAAARVAVGTRARLQARGPAETMPVPMGEVNTFPVAVTNQGNASDTFTITSLHPTAKVLFSPAQLTLPPGGSGVIQVSVVPVGTYSPGYLYLIALQLQSTVDASVRSVVAARQTYTAAGTDTGTDSADPQLTFRVRLSGGVNVTYAGGELNSSFDYAVVPSATLTLSDSVTSEVAPLPFSGTSDQFWQPPGTFGFSVSGPDWTLGLNLGQGGGSLQGGFTVGGWKLGAGGFVRRPFGGGWLGGVRINAETGLGPGVLALTGNTTVRWGGPDSGHSENFGVQYRWNLAPGLSLGLGAGVSGATTAQGYRAAVTVSEVLNWETEHFDLTQTYTGSTAGVHVLSVSGGTRSISPFGVRFAGNFELQPTGQTWRAAALGLWSPAPNLNFTLSGQYRSSTVPGAKDVWSVGVSGGYRFQVGIVRGRAVGRFGVTATEGEPLRYTVGADLSLTAGAVDVSARASLVTLGPAQQFDLGVKATAQLGTATRLGLGYGLVRAEDASVRHDFSVSWQERWTQDVHSALTYQTSVKSVPGGVLTWPQSVTAQVGVANVLQSGVGLGLSYTLSSTNGWSGDYAHKLRLELGTQLQYSLDTPDAVVQLFGGRIGGEVKGRAFVDANLNGQLDAGEAPLAGLTLGYGKQTVTTAADGSYRLRVPTGTYQPRVVSGLSAKLEAYQLSKVTVKENSRLDVNLAFTPINALLVEVFDDRNRNGSRDPNEPGLPFATVQIAGPVQRESFANGQGVLRLGGLPSGRYTVTLDPAKLPERYEVTTAPVQVQISEEATTPAQLLGAAERPREQVSSFTSGSLGVLASLSSAQARPGETVTLQLRLQGEVQSITVEAFGTSVAVGGRGNLRTLDLSVPAGLAPGEHEIRVEVSGPAGQRTASVRLVVTAPP